MIGIAVGIPCGIFFSPRKGSVSTYSYDKTKDFDLLKDGYKIQIILILKYCIFIISYFLLLY